MSVIPPAAVAPAPVAAPAATGTGPDADVGDVFAALVAAMLGELPTGRPAAAVPDGSPATEADDGSDPGVEPPAAPTQAGAVPTAGPAPSGPTPVPAAAGGLPSAPAPVPARSTEGDSAVEALRPGTPGHVSPVPAEPHGPSTGTAGAATLELDADVDTGAQPTSRTAEPRPLAVPTAPLEVTDAPDQVEPPVDAAPPAPAAPGPPSTEGSATVRPATAPVAAPTSSVAPAPASAPPAPALPDQLVEVVAPLRQGPDGSHRVAIQLRPHELGEVVVDVHVRGGEVSLSLRADRPETADLLREALSELRAQLESAGFRSGALDVGSHADRRAHDRAPEGPARPASDTDGAPSDDSDHQPTASAGARAAGLDLRL